MVILVKDTELRKKMGEMFCDTKELALKTELAYITVWTLVSGKQKHTTMKTAKKICSALNSEFKDIFEVE